MGFFTPRILACAKYDIYLKLAIEEGRYYGHETITWENTSGLSVSVLQLAAGAVDITTLTVGGAACNAVYTDGLIIITLAKPLAFRDCVTLALEFDGPLPVSRFCGGGLYEFTREPWWYPKLRWDVPTADDYTVSVDIPQGFVARVSGRLNSGVFTADHIPCFGMVISKDFPVLTETVDGVELNCFYFPENKPLAESVLATAREALLFYKDLLGFYPHNAFTVIPGSEDMSGGYPVATGIVYLHKMKSLAAYEHNNWIVTHEMGHQYFGEYVLDDEFPGWLWLGLGLSVDRELALVKNNGSVYAEFDSELREAIREGKDTTLIRSFEQTNLALNDETFEYYSTVCHGKSAAVMIMLQRLIGKDCYFAVLRRCLQEFGGKVLRTADFISLCEAESGTSLQWFFDDWLYSNKSLKYGLATVTIEGVLKNK